MGAVQDLERVLDQARAALSDCNAALSAKGAPAAASLSDVPSRIAEIESASGDSWYDAFWDSFQQNGERYSYNSAFKGVYWTDGSFRPKYDIVPRAGTNIQQAFFQCNITDLRGILDERGVVIDTSKCEELNGVFYQSTITRPPIIDASKCLEFISTFGGSNMTEIVINNIQETATFNSATFNNANSLTTLTVTGIIGTDLNLSYARYLSVDSMKNIIACLKNYAGTEYEGTYKLTLPTVRWTALEASGSAPDGGTWKAYVVSLGWTY